MISWPNGRHALAVWFDLLLLTNEKHAIASCVVCMVEFVKLILRSFHLNLGSCFSPPYFEVPERKTRSGCFDLDASLLQLKYLSSTRYLLIIFLNLSLVGKRNYLTDCSTNLYILEPQSHVAIQMEKY